MMLVLNARKARKFFDKQKEMYKEPLESSKASFSKEQEEKLDKKIAELAKINTEKLVNKKKELKKVLL